MATKKTPTRRTFRHRGVKFGEYRPDPLVVEHLDAELDAQDAALEAADAAYEASARLEADIARLEADRIQEPETLAVELATKREALSVATKRCELAERKVKDAARRLLGAEEAAFGSPEVIAQRRDLILDTRNETARRIAEARQRFTDDLVDALSNRRLVNRSIHAERLQLSRTLTGQALADLGQVNKWTGYTRRTTPADVNHLLDQIEATLTDWAHGKLVAHSITGESGIHHCTDMTFTPDDLTPEQVRKVEDIILDPRAVRRWRQQNEPTNERVSNAGRSA